MEVGVVVKRNDAAARQVGEEIIGSLVPDAEVLVDAMTAAAIGREGVSVGEMSRCELVVSVGGDGTLLFVVREVGDTPVLGVNLGEVGFLTKVTPEDAVSVIQGELDRIREAGQPRIQRLPRLRAEGGEVAVPLALNEILVMGERRGRNQGIETEIMIDGQPYYSGRVDGVIVSTPTGSTAYNMSEHGPLVHPSVECFVVTGMAPRGGMPSLVIEQERTVTVRVSGTGPVNVVSDGQTQTVTGPTSVRVSRSETDARLAGPVGEYFVALEKLR